MVPDAEVRGRNGRAVRALSIGLNWARLLDVFGEERFYAEPCSCGVGHGVVHPPVNNSAAEIAAMKNYPNIRSVLASPCV